MSCAESANVHALFDGELDRDASLGVSTHLRGCQECTDLMADLQRSRTLLKGESLRLRAPPTLRTRVLAALDSEQAAGATPSRPLKQRPWRLASFWWGSLSGAGATLVAGTLLFFTLVLPYANPMVDAVLEAHVGSLTTGHLTEVASTDRHTVKPWFAGRVPVSPAVADFTSQGYHLTGGRVDLLKNQPAAVMVYQHGAHIINLFCWIAPHGMLPANTTRHGYRLAFWRSGDLAYAAVSDTSWDELLRLETLARATETSQNPPQGVAPVRE